MVRVKTDSRHAIVAWYRWTLYQWTGVVDTWRPPRRRHHPAKANSVSCVSVIPDLHRNLGAVALRLEKYSWVRRICWWFSLNKMTAWIRFSAKHPMDHGNHWHMWSPGPRVRAVRANHRRVTVIRENATSSTDGH